MPDNSIKPKIECEIDFKFPAINKIQLSNGIEVLHFEKNKLPIIQVIGIIEAGSKFDPDGKNGLANLTAMMIDEGAGSLSSLEIDDAFESMGCVFDIGCNQDFVLISLLSLKENFKRAFDITGDILSSPHFNENDFAREKSKLKTKILEYNDDPDYIASTNFEHILCGNTGYRHPAAGRIDDIESLTVNEIRDNFNKYFSSGNIKFVVVGDITSEELVPVMEVSLSKILKGEIGKPAFNIPVYKSGIYIIDKPDSAQSEIRIGNLSSSRNAPDFYAKNILNTVLGGQFTSRINHNLREVKGFTYGAFSAFNYFKQASYLILSTSVNSDNTGESIKELNYELTRIFDDISDEEIEFAKTYLIRRLPGALETYSQIARNLSNIMIYNLDPDYFNKYVNFIKSTTREDILKACTNNIKPSELVTLIVGDLKKLESQLPESYGNINVIKNFNL